MIEKCYICGAECDIEIMDSFNVGRRRKYMCPGCSKIANKQVAARMALRHNMIEKKQDNAKRN